MSKNIVLFSDGTGNSSGKLFKTNVWRTYQAVDVADPKTSGETHQVAFYDDGVGTSTFKPLAILGGAAGLGLARNVREIYSFICRNYQPGDKIYAFGFSRGAFTIRVLVDFILTQGLVPYDGEEAALQRWVGDAYRAYRAKGYHTRFSLMKLVRPLRDGAIFAQNWALRRVPYSAIQPIQVPAIQFLGLWDTVDAYGLPFEELTRAIVTVARLQTYLSPAIAGRIVEKHVTQKTTVDGDTAFSVLTVREREILQLLAEGKSAKEIAGTLGRSIKTVETHRHNIMTKLDLHSLPELTKYAIREGLTGLEK